MQNTLHKSITIHTTPEKLWSILTTDALIRKRATPFSEGTYAITDWKPGSDITRFVGNEICTKGKLTTLEENKKIISTFYEGNTKDGFTDKLNNSIESYEIIASKNGVQLNIISGPMLTEERIAYGEMMSNMRDQALIIIKQLCE